MIRAIATMALASLPLAVPALGKAGCQIPARLPPHDPAEHRDGKRRVAPVGGYRLALSWSPEYCRNRGGGIDALQCGPGAIAPFGFILHGLWPQGTGARWPQYCRPVAPVPEAVVRQTLCLTPSVKLIQHEWAKHGSCMARSPQGYFEAAQILFAAYRAPDMMALSRRALTVAGLQSAFARRNPGLNPQAVSVRLNRRGWLEEIGICLDGDFRNRACPAWERGADRDARIKIWRGRGAAYQ